MNGSEFYLRWQDDLSPFGLTWPDRSIRKLVGHGVNVEVNGVRWTQVGRNLVGDLSEMPKVVPPEQVLFVCNRKSLLHHTARVAKHLVPSTLIAHSAKQALKKLEATPIQEIITEVTLSLPEEEFAWSTVIQHPSINKAIVILRSRLSDERPLNRIAPLFEIEFSILDVLEAVIAFSRGDGDPVLDFQFDKRVVLPLSRRLDRREGSKLEAKDTRSKKRTR